MLTCRYVTKRPRWYLRRWGSLLEPTSPLHAPLINRIWKWNNFFKKGDCSLTLSLSLALSLSLSLSPSHTHTHTRIHIDSQDHTSAACEGESFWHVALFCVRFCQNSFLPNVDTSIILDQFGLRKSPAPIYIQEPWSDRAYAQCWGKIR